MVKGEIPVSADNDQKSIGKFPKIASKFQNMFRSNKDIWHCDGCSDTVKKTIIEDEIMQLGGVFVDIKIEPDNISVELPISQPVISSELKTSGYKSLDTGLFNIYTRDNTIVISCLVVLFSLLLMLKIFRKENPNKLKNQDTFLAPHDESFVIRTPIVDTPVGANGVVHYFNDNISESSSCSDGETRSCQRFLKNIDTELSEPQSLSKESKERIKKERSTQREYEQQLQNDAVVSETILNIISDLNDECFRAMTLSEARDILDRPETAELSIEIHDTHLEHEQQQQQQQQQEHPHLELVLSEDTADPDLDEFVDSEVPVQPREPVTPGFNPKTPFNTPYSATASHQSHLHFTTPGQQTSQKKPLQLTVDRNLENTKYLLAVKSTEVHSLTQRLHCLESHLTKSIAKGAQRSGADGGEAGENAEQQPALEVAVVNGVVVYTPSANTPLARTTVDSRSPLPMGTVVSNLFGDEVSDIHSVASSLRSVATTSASVPDKTGDYKTSSSPVENSGTQVAPSQLSSLVSPKRSVDFLSPKSRTKNTPNGTAATGDRGHSDDNEIRNAINNLESIDAIIKSISPQKKTPVKTVDQPSTPTAGQDVAPQVVAQSPARTNVSDTVLQPYTGIGSNLLNTTSGTTEPVAASAPATTPAFTKTPAPAPKTPPPSQFTSPPVESPLPVIPQCLADNVVYNTTIVAMNKTIREIKAKKIELLQNIATLASDNKALETRLAEAHQTTDEFKETIDTLSADKTAGQQRISALEAALIKLVADEEEHNSKAATFQAQIAQLEQQLQVASSEDEKTLSALRLQLEESVAAAEESENTISTLKMKVGELLRKRSEDTTVVDSLQEELRVASALLTAEKSTVADLTAQLDALNDECVRASSELNHKLMLAEAAHSDIVFSLHSQLVESGNSVSRHRDTISSLESQLREEVIAVQQHSAIIQQLNERLDECESSLDEQSDTIDRLTEELERANDGAEGLRGFVLDLRKQLSESIDLAARQSVTISELNAELAEAKRSAGVHADHLASLTADLAQSERIVAEHTESIAELNELLEESRRAVQELTVAAADLTTRLEQSESLVSNHNDTIATLTEQLTQSVNEASGHKEDISKLETELSKAVEKASQQAASISSLEAQLGDALAVAAEYNLIMDDMRVQLTAAEARAAADHRTIEVLQFRAKETAEQTSFETEALNMNVSALSIRVDELQSQLRVEVSQKELLAVELATIAKTHQLTLDSLTADCDQLQQKITEQQESITQTSEKHVAEVSTLQIKFSDEVASHLATKQMVTDVSASLESAGLELSAQKEQAIVELGALQSELSSTHAQLQSSVEACYSKDEELARVYADLDEAIVTLAKSAGTVESTEKELSELRALLEEKEKDAESLSTAVLEANARIANLTETIESVEASSAQTSAELQQVTERNSTLSAEISSLAEAKQRLSADLEGSVTALDATRQEVGALTESLSQQTAQNELLVLQRDEISRNLETLTSKHAQLTANKSALEAEVAAVESSIAGKTQSHEAAVQVLSSRVAELETEKTAADKEVVELSNILSERAAEMSALREVSAVSESAHSAEKLRLEEQVALRQAEVQGLTTKCHALTLLAAQSAGVISALRSKLTYATAAATFSAQNESVEERLEQVRAECASKLRASEHDYSLLSQQLGAANEKLSALTDKLSGKEQSIAEESEKNRLLSEHIEQNATRFNELQLKLENNLETIASLEQNNAELRGTVAALNETVAEQDSKLTSCVDELVAVRADMSQKDFELSGAQQAMSVLKGVAATKNRLQKEVGVQAAVVAAIKSDNVALSTELVELKMTLSGLQEQLETAQREHSRAISEKDSILCAHKAEVDTLQQRCAEYLQQNEEITSQLTLALEAQSSQSEKVSHAESELASTRSEVAALQTQLTQKTSQLKKAERSFASITDSFTEANAELSQLKPKFAHALAVNKQREQVITKAAFESERLSKQYAVQSKVIQALKSENAKLISTLEDKHTQLNELSDSIGAKTSEVEALRAELTDKETELQLMRDSGNSGYDTPPNTTAIFPETPCEPTTDVMADLQTQVAQLSALIAQKDDEIFALNEKLVVEADQHSALAASAAAQASKEARRYEIQSGLLDTLKKEKNEIAKAHGLLATAVQQKTEECSRAEKEYKIFESRFNLLYKEHKILTVAHDAIQQQFEEKTEQLDHHHDEIRRQHDVIADLKSSVSAKNIFIAECNQSIVELQAQLMNSDQECKLLAGKNKTLEADGQETCRAYELIMAELETTIAEHSDTIEALNRDLVKLTEEKTALASAVETEQSELQTVRGLLAESESKLASLEQSMQSMQSMQAKNDAENVAKADCSSMMADSLDGLTPSKPLLDVDSSAFFNYSADITDGNLQFDVSAVTMGSGLNSTFITPVKGRGDRSAPQSVEHSTQQQRANNDGNNSDRDMIATLNAEIANYQQQIASLEAAALHYVSVQNDAEMSSSSLQHQYKICVGDKELLSAQLLFLQQEYNKVVRQLFESEAAMLERIDKLNIRNSELKGEIGDLLLEIAELTDRNAELTQQNAAHEQLAINYEHSAAAANETVAALTSTAASLGSQLEAVQSELAAKCAELSQLQADHLALTKSLESQVAQYSFMMDGYNQTKIQFKQIADEHSALQTEHSKLLSESKETEAQFKSRSVELKTMIAQERETLNALIQSKNLEVTEALEKLAALQSEKDHTNMLMLNMHDNNERTCSKLSKQTSVQANLIATLRDKCSKLTADIAQQKETLRFKQVHLDELERQKEDVTTRYNWEMMRNAELRAELQQAHEHIAVLQNRLAEFEEKVRPYQQAQSDIAELLKRERDTIDRELRDGSNTLFSRDKNEIINASKQAIALNDVKLAEATRMLDALNSENGELLESLSEAHDRIAALMEQIERNEELIRQLREQLSAAQEAHNTSTEHISELEEALKSQYADLEHATKVALELDQSMLSMHSEAELAEMADIAAELAFQSPTEERDFDFSVSYGSPGIGQRVSSRTHTSSHSSTLHTSTHSATHKLSSLRYPPRNTYSSNNSTTSSVNNDVSPLPVTRSRAGSATSANDVENIVSSMTDQMLSTANRVQTLAVGYSFLQQEEVFSGEEESEEATEETEVLQGEKMVSEEVRAGILANSDEEEETVGEI